MIKKIEYFGVDLNSIWFPIHHQIKKLLQDVSEVKVRYTYRDIFRVLEKIDSTWRPNVLMLQYVISDMVANSESREVIDLIPNIIRLNSNPWEFCSCAQLVMHNKRTIRE